MKFLILGVSGNVSTGIVRSIRQSDIAAYIVGACVSNNAPGFAFCDAIAQSPYADSNQFLSWLQNIIEINDIDTVKPKPLIKNCRLERPFSSLGSIIYQPQL